LQQNDTKIDRRNENSFNIKNCTETIKECDDESVGDKSCSYKTEGKKQAHAVHSNAEEENTKLQTIKDLPMTTRLSETPSISTTGNRYVTLSSLFSKSAIS
jgi:hypothetical protein